jgi:hypothetical protein
MTDCAEVFCNDQERAAASLDVDADHCVHSAGTVPAALVSSSTTARDLPAGSWKKEGDVLVCDLPEKKREEQQGRVEGDGELARGVLRHDEPRLGFFSVGEEGNGAGFSLVVP